jgi:hypothetical protein
LHLFVVQLSSGIDNGLLNGLAGSFQILSFFKLKLSL